MLCRYNVKNIKHFIQHGNTKSERIQNEKGKMRKVATFLQGLVEQKKISS